MVNLDYGRLCSYSLGGGGSWLVWGGSWDPWGGGELPPAIPP